MSDLISRSALLKEFQTRSEVYDFFHGSSIKAFIENAPIAYNVDAVVAEMERERQKMEKIFDLEAEECCRGYAEAMEAAIEIVRKGGVE